MFKRWQNKCLVHTVANEQVDEDPEDDMDDESAIVIQLSSGDES